MKVRAKVLEVEPLISGSSDNGNDWEKQQVVVETLEFYPQVLAVDFMGVQRTAVTKTLKPGDVVTFNLRIRCRKWGYKWFTGLDGSTIAVESRLGGQGDTATEAPTEAPTEPPVDLVEQETELFGNT